MHSIDWSFKLINAQHRLELHAHPSASLPPSEACRAQKHLTNDVWCKVCKTGQASSICRSLEWGWMRFALKQLGSHYEV